MTVTRFFRSAPLALVLALGLSACDAQLQDSPESMSLTARAAVDVMPEDALAVGRIDFRAVAENPLTTPFGEAGFLTRELKGEAEARFNDFTEATGLDPETDLTEVYGAIEAGTSDERLSLAVYGDFDTEALASYVESRLGSELGTESHAGVTIYRGQQEQGVAFAFASEDMILVGSDAPTVALMIDRLQGRGTSLADNAALMERIARAASAGDLWGLALKPEGTDAGNPLDELDGELGQLWVAVDAAGGAVTVQPEALETHIQLYPTEGVSADDLASLVRGAIALARGAEGLDDDNRSILDDARVEAEDDYVSVRIETPNTFLQGLARH